MSAHCPSPSPRGKTIVNSPVTGILDPRACWKSTFLPLPSPFGGRQGSNELRALETRMATPAMQNTVSSVLDRAVCMKTATFYSSKWSSATELLIFIYCNLWVTLQREVVETFKAALVKSSELYPGSSFPLTGGRFVKLVQLGTNILGTRLSKGRCTTLIFFLVLIRILLGQLSLFQALMSPRPKPLTFHIPDRKGNLFYIQWNPVNMNTKGTGRIVRVSVLTL